VLRAFVFKRAIRGAIQSHRPEIDVLLEFEPEAEQNALFQDAGFHLRMADGAEEKWP